jgi:hypothetical protein
MPNDRFSGFVRVLRLLSIAVSSSGWTTIQGIQQKVLFSFMVRPGERIPYVVLGFLTCIDGTEYLLRPAGAFPYEKRQRGLARRTRKDSLAWQTKG